MRPFSKKLKMVTMAGLAGIGLAGVLATSASADYAYTQCDRDGDRCWQVRCDDDGDDCRSVNNNAYYNRGYYRPNYYGQYSPYRRWVCDEDGDRCHRTNYGYRPAWSFGFGWGD